MIEFVIIAVISSILAGMGIGGGALFVILITMFLKYDQIDAQALNLIMFVFSGISASIANGKKKIILKDVLKKTLPFLIIGSVIGITLLKNIPKEKISTYFNVFMLFLGIYEIFSSLIKAKKAKDNKGIRKENWVWNVLKEQ